MKRLRKIIPWLGLLVAGALLTAHVFGLGSLQVDSSTLVLLGLFLLVPYLDIIRKIKIGEFEAEIGPREVQKAVAKASSELGAGAVIEGDESADKRGLRRLAKEDPQLALAKLRIELERALNSISRLGKPESRSRRAKGVGRLVSELESEDRLPPEIGSAIRDILLLANRAVHGDFVRTEDAVQLAGVGTRILSELQEIYANLVLTVEDSRAITANDAAAYRSSMYRVTSVIPLVPEPILNVRTVSQEGLDMLLEGYNEYAEYIVGVERIEPGERRNDALYVDDGTR